MSWQIDPGTGDYVMTQGKPVDDSSLIYPAYYRLTIGRARWMYAPDDQYGSDLHTLKKRNDKAMVDMTERAMQPMIDDGRALSADVTLNPPAGSVRSNTGAAVVITDAQGNPEVLPLPPVGD